MLFIVRVLSGGRPYWSVTVEAEDREGAKREAMLALSARMGRFVRKAPFGELAVEVEAVSRDFARATITELVGA